MATDDVLIYISQGHEDAHEVMQLLGEHGIQAVSTMNFSGINWSEATDFSNLPTSLFVPAGDGERARQILKNHSKNPQPS